jgi:hypothetical protein
MDRDEGAHDGDAKGGPDLADGVEQPAGGACGALGGCGDDACLVPP